MAARTWVGQDLGREIREFPAGMAFSKMPRASWLKNAVTSRIAG